jgi:hypothetical protein
LSQVRAHLGGSTLHLVRSEEVLRTKESVGPVRPELACNAKSVVVPRSRCESGQVVWRRYRFDSSTHPELVDVAQTTHTRS